MFSYILNDLEQTFKIIKTVYEFPFSVYAVNVIGLYDKVL